MKVIEQLKPLTQTEVLQLIADLARVTAELGEIKGIVGYPGSESLRAAGLSDSLPDVVRWTHREWLRQTHAATQRVLKEQSVADTAEAKLKAAREALEAVIEECDGYTGTQSAAMETIWRIRARVVAALPKQEAGR